MSTNKGKTKETKIKSQGKNGDGRETGLLSDILPLPDPRSRSASAAPTLTPRRMSFR
jgi:hypothetical protein